VSVRVAIITTARSDYGPLYWVIHDLFAAPGFDVQLIVGGSHLSARYGSTVQEIERDGWSIAARMPFLEENDDAVSFGRSCGNALKMYSELFTSLRPGIAIVYGDRIELLPIVTAALVSHTPVAHLCGGDVTVGAMDDQVRHAVTKMAHLHFPSTERSAERILQMGEEPWRVHLVGDPALDQLVRGTCASAAELASLLGFLPDRETLLVTFHPATLELDDVRAQAVELAAALRAYDGPVVITAPAPDPGSELIRAELKEMARTRGETVFMESLGSYNYRGLMRMVGAMVGNSSSGLNEAPSVRLPVVNIGNRQKGRDRSENVLDVAPRRDEICAGIRIVLSENFNASLVQTNSLYGDGNAARRILEVLSRLVTDKRLTFKMFASLSSGKVRQP